MNKEKAILVKRLNSLIYSLKSQDFSAGCTD